MTGAAPAPLWKQPYPAPAKLNLFLHVTGRRPDGFHTLQTVFRLIDLCDTLRFSPRLDERIVRSSVTPGVPPADDLCVRAAQALRAATGGGAGVDIHLHKKIPMGGGLGGGSSDAATTLMALNRLWRLGLGQTELMAIGLRLGADVPFFLLGSNAFAEGVGEVLTPVILGLAWYVILVPPVAVPTAAIFAAPELTRNTKTIKISSFSAGLGTLSGAAKSPAPSAPFGHNDLESVVCRRYPKVAAHLDWLRLNGVAGEAKDGALSGAARLTGSGACVFAEFATMDEARRIVLRMPKGMRGMVARGLERHPILKRL